MNRSGFSGWQLHTDMAHFGHRRELRVAPVGESRGRFSHRGGRWHLGL